MGSSEPQPNTIAAVSGTPQTAPEGTTFTTSDTDGRIDAALAPGSVRIELPRAAARASLTVDGRPYLEKLGERIDYPGPPALVEGPRVRFEVR